MVELTGIDIILLSICCKSRVLIIFEWFEIILFKDIFLRFINEVNYEIREW